MRQTSDGIETRRPPSDLFSPFNPGSEDLIFDTDVLARYIASYFYIILRDHAGTVTDINYVNYVSTFYIAILLYFLYMVITSEQIPTMISNIWPCYITTSSNLMYMPPIGPN